MALTSKPTNNGITLSDLTVEADGTVRAVVTPECWVGTANDAGVFHLRVTDSSGQTAEDRVAVFIGENEPPVLTYAPTHSVVQGGSLTITPTDGPYDRI